jgi:starch phosphorylase
VTLGDLGPADVDVQVVYGRVDDSDRLADSATLSLRHDEAYEGSRHRYIGEVKLDRPGPFGYTARIVPRHRLTTGPGELGLATLPAESAGMDSGVLR